MEMASFASPSGASYFYDFYDLARARAQPNRLLSCVICGRRPEEPTRDELIRRRPRLLVSNCPLCPVVLLFAVSFGLVCLRC